MADKTKIQEQVSKLAGFDEMFGSDPGTEASGAWMDVPQKPGWRIRLRCQHTPRVADAATTQQRKYASIYASRKVPPSESLLKDQINLMADHIVVDWEGFVADGEKVPCTPDAVRAVMTQYSSFRDICLAWSADRSNYRDGGRKEDTVALGETSPTA